MKKADRQIIFDKYGGCCAYCGDPLQKGWHVDEIEPVRRGKENIKDTNGKLIWCSEKREYKAKVVMRHPDRMCIENQNPSCPSCNINKHSLSLEEFRKSIAYFMKHLNGANTQYKIAKRFGLVTETNIEVKFYFESFTPSENSLK